MRQQERARGVGGDSARGCAYEWLRERSRHRFGLRAPLARLGQPGENAGDLLRQVDWARTKAYATGLGGIYLNIAGREEQGIVPGTDAEMIKAALAQGLTGLRDPERGNALAITRAQSREAVYHGPYVEEAPDILARD